MSANSYYTSTAPCTTVLENAVNPAHPCLLANTSQTSNPFEAMAKTSRHARSKSLSILRDLAYKRRHTFYKSTIAANPILLWRMAQFGWEIIHPVTIYLSFNHRETLSTAAQCSVLRGGGNCGKYRLCYCLCWHIIENSYIFRHFSMPNWKKALSGSVEVICYLFYMCLPYPVTKTT